MQPDLDIPLLAGELDWIISRSLFQPWDVQKMCRDYTLGHDLVGMVVLGFPLDLMILEVFPNLMIMSFAHIMIMSFDHII